MADELDILAAAMNRLIEQERFSEAHAMLPAYTTVLDRRLRQSGGEVAFKRALETFHGAIAKVKSARAHMSAQLSDLNRARAYTGESSETPSGWQLIG
jgi:hypothetical protein